MQMITQSLTQIFVRCRGDRNSHFFSSWPQHNMHFEILWGKCVHMVIFDLNFNNRFDVKQP